MIYNLSNNDDVKNIVSQNTLYFDFLELISCINKGINQKLKVDLRFDTENGISVQTGRIITSTYDNVNNVLELELSDGNNIINHSFPVIKDKVEHNNNSDNITFIKTYIQDINHKVIVGFIFHLS